MAKTLRIVSGVISAAVIFFVVALAFLLAGVRLFGYTPYTVLSGSMEPAYHVGSVIYVKEVPPASLAVGDVITYRLPGGTVVTHRIIEVLNEGSDQPSFLTKGDANRDHDGTPVLPQAILGRAGLSVPYLGYLADFVQKPVGLIFVIGLCLVLFLISSLVDSLCREEKKKAPLPDSEQGSKGESPLE